MSPNAKLTQLEKLADAAIARSRSASRERKLLMSNPEAFELACRLAGQIDAASSPGDATPPDMTTLFDDPITLELAIQLEERIQHVEYQTIDTTISLTLSAGV